MIPYATVEAAEAALGRAMTAAEAAWFRYSGSTLDYCLYLVSFVVIFACYSLMSLPLALLELYAPAKLSTPYKLQPQVRLSPASFLRCYKDSACAVLLLTIGPLLYLPYPIVKMAGIRTGLPLPSVGEVAAQLLVYMLVDDFLGYWHHRLMHTRWAYDKIHYVHHLYPAPMGYAAAHSHWVELLTLGIPYWVLVVPCHITTCWLYFAIRGFVAIHTHSGFDFPFSPTKLIPFYGGAEFHDHHHSSGRSNFSPLFTYCDHIYGTDKGYEQHKASLQKLSW